LREDKVFLGKKFNVARLIFRQIARDDLLSQKVIELFNKWKDNKLFADSFIKIIRETAVI
jgi:hypothetical protein